MRMVYECVSRYGSARAPGWHIAAVLAALAGIAAAAPLTAQAPATRSPAALGELSRSLQDLAAAVSPSVVQIFVTGYAPPEEEEPHGGGQPTFERTSGSGVIVVSSSAFSQ